MSEYMDEYSRGQDFLDQHQALLQSLILSKQNANSTDYTEGTNGVSDGTQQSSQGVD